MRHFGPRGGTARLRALPAPPFPVPPAWTLGLLTAAFLAGSLAPVFSPALQAAGATVSLSPASGGPGTSVSVSGSGFWSGETVLLRWDGLTGSVLARPSADGSGSFSGASFTVPNAASGSYSVWAIGDSSSNYSTAAFTVTDGAATATPVPPTATATPPPSPTATTAPPPTATASPVAPVPGVRSIPGGPAPSAGAPVAVAVDPDLRRLYVVHRALYRDLKVNADLLPTDRVSVVNADTGAVVATVPVGRALNGAGQGIAIDSTRGRIYVTNADDDTVTIIDTSTNRVVATVPAGNEPAGVAVDVGRGLVYIANISGKSVSILDASTGAMRGAIVLAGGAHAVAVDGSTHLAYVTVNAAPWTVVALNGETQAIEAQVPLNFLFSLSGISVDPGSRVYASDYDSGNVAAIDISGAAPRELLRFKAGLFLQGVSVSPQTRRVYVTDSGNNQVSIFDAAGASVGSVPVLRLPTVIVQDAAAGRAYVANTMSDSISVVDTGRGAVAATIPLGTAGFGIAYEPSVGRLYVANYPADAVSVVDPLLGTVVGSWPVGAGPAAVAVDPGVQQIYVVNNDDRNLAVLDLAGGGIKARLDLGRISGAAAVAVDTASHRVYAGGDNGLLVLDGATNQVVTTLSLGPRIAGIAVDEAGRRVFVASLGAGTISVVDAGTNQVVATWSPRLSSVWGLAFDAALKRLYVTVPPNTIGAFSGVQVLNSDTGEFVAQLETGNRAALVAVNQTTHQVFVTDSTDGTVAIVDGSKNALVTRVAVGSGPNGLSIDPSSGLVYVANFLDGTISVVDPKTQGTSPGPVASPTPQPTAAPCVTPTSAAGAPVLLAPANCAVLSGFQTSLTWTNPAGATQFELRILPFGSDGPGADVIGNVQGTGGSFNVLAPPAWYFLLPDMAYTWTVRTNNLDVFIGPDDPRWGPWSPAFTFRTPKVSPETVRAVAPQDGAAADSLTPVLQWSDGNPASWYYEIQVSADPDFGPNGFLYWELRHGGVTQPPNSYAIPSAYPLLSGQVYYWRVRTRVQGDGTALAWPPASSFRTPANQAQPPSPTATAIPSPTATPTPSPSPTAAPMTGTAALLPGAWRVYSATIYYDDGRRGSDDPVRYGRLELRQDASWQFGTSTGAWSIEDITEADWARWAIPAYGPSQKLVLSGWSGGTADGPIETSDGQVNFLWAIYHADPPAVSAPGTVWLKFGRG